MKTSSSMSGGEEHTRLVSSGAEEAGMKGCADVAAEESAITALANAFLGLALLMFDRRAAKSRSAG